MDQHPLTKGISTWCTSSGYRLEHAAILTGCEARAALEQAAEERRIFVTGLQADFIHRHLPGLEQTLGFFNSQVLQVVDQRDAGSGFETSLQGALRNICQFDDLPDGIAVTKMTGKPLLAGANNGIRVRGSAYQRCVG